MIVLTPDLEAQKREQEKKAQFEALVKRANSEDPIAAFKLAHYYYKKQEFIKAPIYLREAAIQGHVEAMYELARMYEIGEGVPSSYVATKKWYREALKRGHPKAKRWFIKEFFILLMNTIFFVAAVAILGSSIICIPYIFIKMILKHLG